MQAYEVSLFDSARINFVWKEGLVGRQIFCRNGGGRGGGGLQTTTIDLSTDYITNLGRCSRSRFKDA